MATAVAIKNVKQRAAVNHCAEWSYNITSKY